MLGGGGIGGSSPLVPASFQPFFQNAEFLYHRCKCNVSADILFLFSSHPMDFTLILEHGQKDQPNRFN